MTSCAQMSSIVIHNEMIFGERTRSLNLRWSDSSVSARTFLSKYCAFSLKRKSCRMDTVSIDVNAIVERVMSKFPARDRTEVVHCLKILKVAIDAKRISPQDFAALTAAMQNGETYPEPILARLLPREAEPI
jgi:hypothetical protein